jgi:hypothetical protein
MQVNLYMELMRSIRFSALSDAVYRYLGSTEAVTIAVFRAMIFPEAVQLAAATPVCQVCLFNSATAPRAGVRDHDEVHSKAKAGFKHPTAILMPMSKMGRMLFLKEGGRRVGFQERARCSWRV